MQSIRPNKMLVPLTLLAGSLWVCQAMAAENGPVNADKTEHWSLKPLVKPVVPLVKNSKWARNPIDAFVLAKLAEKGMTAWVRVESMGSTGFGESQRIAKAVESTPECSETYSRPLPKIWPAGCPPKQAIDRFTASSKLSPSAQIMNSADCFFSQRVTLTSESLVQTGENNWHS